MTRSLLLATAITFLTNTAVIAQTEDLTEAQIAELQDAFNLFDKNADDLISASELGTIMTSLGQSFSGAELDSMIFEADIDGNGVVNFAEFKIMMAPQVNADLLEQDMIEAFAVFDSDQNGAISKTELGVVMTSLGETLTDQELDQMITEADSSGDGQISFEEFAFMMAQE